MLSFWGDFSAWEVTRSVNLNNMSAGLGMILGTSSL